MEFNKHLNVSEQFGPNGINFPPPLDNSDSDYLSMDYQKKGSVEKDKHNNKESFRRHSTNSGFNRSWAIAPSNNKWSWKLHSGTDGKEGGMIMVDEQEIAKKTKMRESTTVNSTLRTSATKDVLKTGITSSWRIDPHSSDWSEYLQSEAGEVVVEKVTRRASRPVSMVEGISSSLPTSIPKIGTTHNILQEATAETLKASGDLPGSDSPGKQGTNLLTASSCVSLDCKATSHSPVSKFLPRLLRNSFSKIRDSIPSRSKSVDLLKSGSEVEDSEPETSSSDIISPIDEEMVNESMRKGLPIIPFAYPNFVIVNKNVEDTRTLLRENSLKDLKRAFLAVKEEPDQGDVYSDKKSEKPFTLSELDSFSSCYVAASPQSSELSGSKSDFTNQAHQSSYVEMSPQENIFFPRRDFEDDPYMVMDQQKERRKKKERDSYDETIFHLEQSNSSKEDKNNLSGTSFPSQKYPFKTMSMFRRTEDKRADDFDPLGCADGRHYKKGNKHKGDYVFIDLGKNKDYVSMGKPGTWKSLSFYKK